MCISIPRAHGAMMKIKTAVSTAASMADEPVKVLVRVREVSTVSDTPATKDPVSWEVHSSGDRLLHRNLTPWAQRVREHTEYKCKCNRPNESTVELYHRAVKPLVDTFLQGANATIMAYGQTGAGKTFTMMGTDDEPGIIPLCLSQVFSERLHSPHGQSSRLVASYFEIHNDSVFDLLEARLNPCTTPKPLQKLLEVDGRCIVEGLSFMWVTEEEHLKAAVRDCQTYRRTRATAYNRESSRSHTILRLQDGPRVLHLVDLAGSERTVPHAPANSAQHRRETHHINRSIFHLGNCVSRLADACKRAKAHQTGQLEGRTAHSAPRASDRTLHKRRPQPQPVPMHVPYRDCKLTRILRCSLGGASRTLIICCVNPVQSQTTETLSTLHFASMAKKVSNRVVYHRPDAETTAATHESCQAASLPPRGKKVDVDQHVDQMLSLVPHQHHQTALQLLHGLVTQHSALPATSRAIKALKQKNSELKHQNVLLQKQMQRLQQQRRVSQANTRQPQPQPQQPAELSTHLPQSQVMPSPVRLPRRDHGTDRCGTVAACLSSDAQRTERSLASAPVTANVNHKLAQGLHLLQEVAKELSSHCIVSNSAGRERLEFHSSAGASAGRSENEHTHEAVWQHCGVPAPLKPTATTSEHPRTSCPQPLPRSNPSPSLSDAAARARSAAEAAVRADKEAVERRHRLRLFARAS